MPRPTMARGMQGWSAFATDEPELARIGMELLHQRGDGEAFFASVGSDGIPRIHPLNVDVRDGRLLVFVQGHSAKARDLAADPSYALHAHWEAEAPHEFMVRGRVRLVTDPEVRATAAGGWFFRVDDSYPLFELLLEHVLLGERSSPNEWPPRYRSWRSAG